MLDAGLDVLTVGRISVDLDADEVGAGWTPAEVEAVLDGATFAALPVPAT
jgi:hypothetical protein